MRPLLPWCPPPPAAVNRPSGGSRVPHSLGGLSVSPRYGIDTGSTQVTVTGTGFAASSSVLFGGVPGVVVSVTPSQIVVTTPAGTGGNVVDVTVTDVDGSNAVAHSAFTYYSLPTVLGANLTAWWADTMTVSGNSVTQWTDLSGNGRHLATAPLLAAASINGCSAGAGGAIVVSTPANHGFSTGDSVTVSGVVGTSEANGTWTITVLGLRSFLLVGSTFVHAYVSGGSAQDNNNHRPTKSAANVNGHDVVAFTPGTLLVPGVSPNGPQYLASSAPLSALITADTYYCYWLVNITAIQSAFAPFAGTNEGIWAQAPPDFAAGLSVSAAGGVNQMAAWNFGGNVDPTNGESIFSPFTLGGWLVITERHLNGQVGVRVGDGGWAETPSGPTLDGSSVFFVGANFSGQAGITGRIAVGFFTNAQPTEQHDLALLAYLRQYGALG